MNKRIGQKNWSKELVKKKMKKKETQKKLDSFYIFFFHLFFVVSFIQWLKKEENKLLSLFCLIRVS